MEGDTEDSEDAKHHQHVVQQRCDSAHAIADGVRYLAEYHRQVNQDRKGREADSTESTEQKLVTDRGADRDEVQLRGRQNALESLAPCCGTCRRACGARNC